MAAPSAIPSATAPNAAYTIAAGSLHAGDNSLVVNVLSTYGGGGLLAIR
jgi:hypothetical protein